MRFAGPGWRPVCRVEELPVGGVKVLKEDGHHVACFHTEEGALLAIANRCPHEGYPMHQGTVKGCVVTCAWHNFKFDLRDGRCVKGDEDVRTYPVRVEGGQVEVLLEPIDLTAAVPALYESLESGLLDRKIGQAARDSVRLLEAGQTSADIAAALLRFDATYSEFGTTHGTAVALDALTLVDDYEGAERALPLAQAMDQLGEDHHRRGPRPRPRPMAPTEDAASTRARLRALVEAEEADQAEGLLRGSIAHFGAEEVASWLLDPVADHALGFLHSLIYHAKLVPFLASRDWEDADLVLGAHLHRMLQSTRQDILPTWRALRAAMDRVEEDGVVSIAAQDPSTPWRDADLRAQLLDDPPRVSLHGLVDAFRDRAPVEAVLETLLLAASERMLRFDVTIHDDPAVQDGWLDITHGLTGAVAALELCQQGERVRLGSLMCQAAYVVARARALDRPREAWGYRPTDATPTAVSDVAEALGRGDGDGASRAVLACPRTPENLEALGALLLAAPLADQATRAIVVSHLIKTPLAALLAARQLGDHPDAWLPIAACARLLAQPGGERRVGRLVHEAVRFVAHGEIPKVLCD